MRPAISWLFLLRHGLPVGTLMLNFCAYCSSRVDSRSTGEEVFDQLEDERQFASTEITSNPNVDRPLRR